MKNLLRCLTAGLVATAVASVSGFCASAAGAMNPDGNPNLRVADISHYDTITDWNSMASNLDAVYIEVTKGCHGLDTTYTASADAAKSANLKFGFYHYLWPYADLGSDKDQADRFYDAIKGYAYQCVPALDVEETNEDSGMPDLSADQITAAVKTFADEFKAVSGQDIMIYCDPSFANDHLESTLSPYKLWIANWTSNPLPHDTNVWHKWTMWQYTEKGTLPGVDGDVDLDRATDGIFLGGPVVPPAPSTQTSSGDGYSVVSDTYLSDTAAGKTFNINASCTSGSLLIVSTLNNGRQTMFTESVTDKSQDYSINVDKNTVKVSVYLIKGNFSGDGIPTTYGRTLFVKSR